MASWNADAVEMDAEVDVQDNTGSVNSECANSLSHQEKYDHQSSPQRNAQTARSFGDAEHMEYLGHMPEELQEDNIDILIINAEENETEARNFKKLVKGLSFSVHKCLKYPRVKLLEDIRCGSKDPLELAFSKALFVFLYITEEFCDDVWVVLQGQACLKEALNDKDRKWHVIPIHTAPKKNRAYRLPLMLKHLNPINYWDGENKFYDRVKQLLESKTGLLLKRKRDLDENRKGYFKVNRDDILKNRQYVPRNENPAPLSSSVSSSQIGKESNAYKDFSSVSDATPNAGYLVHSKAMQEIPSNKVQPENVDATLQVQSQLSGLSIQKPLGMSLKRSHDGSNPVSEEEYCEGSRILQLSSPSNSEVNHASGSSTSVSNTSGNPVQTATEYNENVHRERVAFAVRPTVSCGNTANVYDSSVTIDGPASDVEDNWPHGHISQAPPCQSNPVSQIPVTPSWQNVSARKLQKNVSVSQVGTSVESPSSESQAAKEVSDTLSSEADEDAASNEEDSAQVLSCPELPPSAGRSLPVDRTPNASRAAADERNMSIRRGKLKPGDEKRILKNYQFLLNEIDAKFLVHFLLAKGVLNWDDKDEINGQSSRAKRTEMLLDKILHSGPGDAYDNFIESLKDEYGHVVKRLNGTDIEDSEVPSSSGSLLANLPDEIKVRVLTDADASRFATCFLNENWKSVLLHLGIPLMTIENEIRQSTSRSSQDAATTLLIKWRQKEHKKATVGALLNVFDEVDKTNVCDIDWQRVGDVVGKIKSQMNIS